jgi:uncharacterized membrane protein SpoIIM required for sporulation
VKEERFVESRLERWRQLRALLEQSQMRGLRTLDGQAVRRLGSLYRSATADLAMARTLGFSPETIAHVNRLCAAAHDLVYARRPTGGAARLPRFLLRGFPRLVRRTLRYHAFALAVFIAGAAGAFLVLRGDPVLADLTLGSVFRERAERSLMTGEYVKVPSLLAPLFSWGLIANNVSVTLAAFALGTLLAVPGALVVMMNGLHLGGGFAVFYDVGVPEVLWTWVAAHGPVELTAIFIASGAGMRVGLAPIFPGRQSRAAAFRERGLDSVAMLGGTAAMLVVAGVLEGFVSPAEIAPWIKWAIGGASIVAMALYFGLAGRESRFLERAS